MSKGVQSVLLLVTCVPLSIALILYQGFVMSVIWGWFLVPLGLPSVSWLVMTGTILVLSTAQAEGAMFRMNNRSEDMKKRQADSPFVYVVSSTINQAFYVSVLLGFAYIIYQFV